MPRKLTLEVRKFILKRYWKTENEQDVIRDWKWTSLSGESSKTLCIRESQEVLKIFDNLLLMHLPTLIMTCAPKFVIVWCHVVENVLKLKASNLNICHRNCLP